MSRIRSADTKPELIVNGWLVEMDFSGSYERNCKGRCGTPDFYFFEFEGYLFVDGGFWHGHPNCFRFGKSGKFWDDKIRRNIERDKKVNRKIVENGGKLLRIWDFEVTGKDNVLVCDVKNRIFTFVVNEGKEYGCKKG